MGNGNSKNEIYQHQVQVFDLHLHCAFLWRGCPYICGSVRKWWFCIWNNTQNEILHTFLVLMTCNTWLFWKKKFFFSPKFLGRIPRSGHVLALLTVKMRKKFFPLYSMFIWYLTPEKLLATIIWGHAPKPTCTPTFILESFSLESTLYSA